MAMKKSTMPSKAGKAGQGAKVKPMKGGKKKGY